MVTPQIALIYVFLLETTETNEAEYSDEQSLLKKGESYQLFTRDNPPSDGLFIENEKGIYIKVVAEKETF